MAEKVSKTSAKSMALNILKIFGIVFGSVLGLIGVCLGIMALAGAFNPVHIEPTGLKFEQNVYVIDGNLEKLYTTDGNAEHIDYRQKTDVDGNPVYETILALPQNEDCTETDAVLRIRSGNSLQLVVDENTTLFDPTEADDETKYHSKYNIKLGSPIKVVPTKETKSFVDNFGNEFERKVNVGGWSVLEIEYGMYLAYCCVFVDVPVYQYDVVAVEQEGVSKYEMTGEETFDDYIPTYVVNNTLTHEKALDKNYLKCLL